MKRISSNESFPRNIILSIDTDEKNYQLNLASFRNYFQDALGDGKAPQDAVEIATEKLRRLVEKRSEVFVEKGYKRKPPKAPKEKPEKPLSVKKLVEEGDILKRKLKLEHKEKILKQLSRLTSETGDKLEELFKRFITKRKSVDSDSIAIKRTIDEYNRLKEPEVEEKEIPTVDDIRKYYDLISSLEPDNTHYNVEQFKKYVLKDMSLVEAFKKVKFLVSARNYMRENNILVTPTNMKIFLVSDGDFELAARRVKEREEAGKLGIDVDNLRAPNASSEDYVIYNGERISLHRLVSSLFLGRTSEKQYKMMYSIIRRNVFDLEKSVDEAVEIAFKELNLVNFRSQLKIEFPEDPSYAETVLESYYIDENMSFQDALRATRRDLGKDSLDKIARKIVVSYYYSPTGNYKEDIENYKSIISDYQTEASAANKKKIARDATKFINSVKMYGDYDLETTKAFLEQAKSIRNEIYGGLDGTKLNNKLFMLLKKHGIVDNNNDVNVGEFTLSDNWRHKIEPEFAPQNSNEIRWLASKLNILLEQIKKKNKPKKDPSPMNSPSYMG